MGEKTFPLAIFYRFFFYFARKDKLSNDVIFGIELGTTIYDLNKRSQKDSRSRLFMKANGAVEFTNLVNVGNLFIAHWRKIAQTEILSPFIISSKFLSALFFHELPIIIKWLNDQLKTSWDRQKPNMTHCDYNGFENEYSWLASVSCCFFLMAKSFYG